MQLQSWITHGLSGMQPGDCTQGSSPWAAPAGGYGRARCNLTWCVREAQAHAGRLPATQAEHNSLPVCKTLT